MMVSWKKELSNVNGMYAQMAQTVAGELAGAMSSAVQGVIDGSTTVEEAMSQMFKNIGQAFIAMATEMIAKALVMKVLGIAMHPSAAHIALSQMPPSRRLASVSDVTSCTTAHLI